MAEPRDRFVPELLAVGVILMAGAGLRYWLSTALPFDARELVVVAEAATPRHGLRVPFIMFNGVSLLAGYLFMRRSAGVAAALAVLLLLQTNLAFQEQALRVRFVALPVLIGMAALTLWRHRLPARRLSPVPGGLMMAVAIVAALRGVFLGVSLPERMQRIRSATHADPQRVFAALHACGGGLVTPLERLQDCEPAPSPLRSLRQQELLFVHRLRVSGGAEIWDGRRPAPTAEPGRVAVFDPAAAAFLVTSAGEQTATAERIVLGAAPDFFAAAASPAVEEDPRE